MDEPLWMMGRKATNGGFCYPVNPSCDQGCIFAEFCPWHWTERDPAEVGYALQSPTKKRTLTNNPRAPGARHRLRVPGPAPKPVDGLLVVGYLARLGCPVGKVRIRPAD